MGPPPLIQINCAKYVRSASATFPVSRVIKLLITIDVAWLHLIAFVKQTSWATSVTNQVLVAIWKAVQLWQLLMILTRFAASICMRAVRVAQLMLTQCTTRSMFLALLSPMASSTTQNASKKKLCISETHELFQPLDPFFIILWFH